MNITNLNTLENISKNFNISLEFLKYIADKEYQRLNSFDKKANSIMGLDSTLFINFSNYVSIIKIEKKNKKRSHQFREVLEIKSPYNIFYKELLNEIECIINLNYSSYITNSAHGFIKNKNILSNAQQHLNKIFLRKYDILNFFNSIGISEVHNIFIKLGCNEETSMLFSNLCTYNGVLKEGLSTSPMIANLFCYDLDHELIKLSEKYKVTYTRYCDDMTFSSNEDNFPLEVELEEILKKYKLNFNKAKTIFVKAGQSQYVTGLSISNPLYPRVPRRLKRKIRQDLYLLNKYFSDDKHENIEYKLREVYGKIIYTIGIEKELGKKFKNSFIEILYKNDYQLSEIFEDSPEKLVNQVFHYVDETDVKINNKHYIALAVVSIFSEDVKRVNKAKLLDLKKKLSCDQRNGLTEEQKEKLFHYCEDNVYTKGMYQDLLRSLDFEAFIIFIEGSSSNMRKNEYKSAYYKIFDTIFYKILRRFNKYNNYIYPEENSKISVSQLEKNLLSIKKLPKFNIEKGTKTEVLLSIPDYVLGIFRDCIKRDLSENIKNLKKNQTLHEDNKLNEILDKIRLVIDYSKKINYARQSGMKLDCINLNQQIAGKILNFEDEIDEKSYHITLKSKFKKLINRVYRKSKALLTIVKESK